MQNYTNQVLYQIQQDLEQPKLITTIYYLPAYLRTKIKRINNMQVAATQGSINATIVLTINYSGIKQEQQRKTIENLLLKKLVLIFNGSKDIPFNSNFGNILIKKNTPLTKDKNFISYVFRGDIQIQTSCNIFFSPFIKMDAWFKVQLKQIEQIQSLFNRKILLRFNLMDMSESDHNQRIYFQGGKIMDDLHGLYHINQTNMCAEYFSQNRQIVMISQHFFQKHFYKQIKTLCHDAIIKQINGNINQNPLSSYNYAKFRFQFRRKPIVQILTIFVPIWILAALNISIFFQEPGIADRIATISTLSLAFIALFPTIRSRIPSTASYTLIDIIIFMSILSSLICIIQGFKNQGIDTRNYRWHSDYWLIISIITLIASILVIVLLYSLYELNNFIIKKMIEEDKKKNESKNRYSEIKLPLQIASNAIIKKIEDGYVHQLDTFDYNQWYNRVCDADFKKDKDIKPVIKKYK